MSKCFVLFFLFDDRVQYSNYRRLPAKNRRGSGWLAGWNGLRARRSDVRDAAPLDTAERGRSSAGFMLMYVCVLASFLYGGTTTKWL